ncbi:hypothetical protein B0H13DRAFT_2119463 [Mycena leptocephala]|nr:hypothetical protein B0H13DRAFT_2119463 [Mycena leptocephala]
MVTECPPEDGALLMPCNGLDPRFSFTSWPHSSSHGFVCNTTAESNENQDAGNHLVYPSPPPTTSQPKRNVPLPAAARHQQYQYGGILDSPVVLMKAPTQTLLSPPPTIPTPTHALPPSDANSSPDAQFSSLLLPIPEQESPSPRPTQSQLLSPISPEWTTSRKTEDLFTVDDSGDCVLMSQPPTGAFDFSFTADVDDDVLGSARSFGRPALHSLDIPMFHGQATAKDLMHEDSAVQGVLLGFHGVMPHLIEEGEDATSPFEYMPPSPSSSRDFDASSESDLDDLDFGMDLSPGPSSYSPSPLRSFASLPSPDLDDLDLDMDLGPGLGMSPSPSRRCVASLPSFDESDSPYYDFSDTDRSSDSSESSDLSMSPPPPHSPPLPTVGVSLQSPHPNALCLDLPVDTLLPKPAPPPSILDAYSPSELAARLPPNFPENELTALLALRRTVPRDAGEPRRRRKRAKELGREVDALVGLALGLLPTEADRDASETQKKAGKAGAGVLVARMILRRRERCVRGLEGGGRRMRTPSPLRVCFYLEGDEPPPASEPPWST